MEIAVGGMSEPRQQTKRHSNNSFAPLRKSAAEMRCDDMLRVHNAEVRRNRDAEAALRQDAERHQSTSKRLRGEREQLKNVNKRLREQLVGAREATVPAQPTTTTPTGAARKRLLDLIRQAHPDKVSTTLDRTKLTQGLNEVLELL